jgi:uncharacterized membrane protein
MNEDKKCPFEKVKPGTSAGVVFYTFFFFLAGLLLVSLGFWKAVFVLCLTLIGYYVGSTPDVKSSLGSFFDKVLPEQNKKIVVSEEEKAQVESMRQDLADKTEEVSDNTPEAEPKKEANGKEE